MQSTKLSSGILFSERFNDIYFSSEDGLEEKTHVFLNGNNLPERWLNTTDNFTIVEAGFGIGLNFFLSWKLWQEIANPIAKLNYISIEKYPLSHEFLKNAITIWPEIANYCHEFLLQYNPNIPQNIISLNHGRIILTIYFMDITDALLRIDTKADTWFLDGFAPIKNPEMWSDNLYPQMARLTNNDGTFSTYTAAGAVRRGLQNNGFQVEKIKGFGKKRTMLRGIYKNQID